MIKYTTHTWRLKIVKVEVTRETDKSIWFADGRRGLKVTDYQRFHNSFEEAKQFLVNVKQKKIDGLKEKLKNAQLDLKNTLLLTDT